MGDPVREVYAARVASLSQAVSHVRQARDSATSTAARNPRIASAWEWVGERMAPTLAEQEGALAQAKWDLALVDHASKCAVHHTQAITAQAEEALGEPHAPH